MSRSTRALLPLFLCAACATPSAPASPPPAAAAIRAAAEGLLPVPDGRRFSELVGGHITVVDFWATWCEPCRDNIPKLQKLARAYESEGLVVVGVDIGEDITVVSRYLAALGPTYPNYLDPELRFADSMGSTSLPSLFLLDREGRVVRQSAVLDAELLAHVRELLDQREPHAGR